jgi:hypothetical protein
MRSLKKVVAVVPAAFDMTFSPEWGANFDD